MNYERYFSENKDQHLSELMEILSIPSISALSDYRPDMIRAANWFANQLIHAGMEHVEIHLTDGFPIVTADYLHAPGKPTVLVYGHYDVQPVDPLPLWTTAPFEPEIRDGKLYARGATDDKGQLFLHIKAVEAILKQEGTLPINIKFCIEGEEELTSPNLPSFLEENQRMLGADVLLISDMAMLEKGRPSITVGLRGVCSLEVSVRTANSDLHSGLFGGGVPNALNALVTLLASLHDKAGKVTVEGFYEGVPEITPSMRAEVVEMNHDEEAVRKSLGLDALYGEEGYSFIERVGVRPTLDFNGVYGGFQGEGLKTVIPREAHAKISCRIVGEQDPQDIINKITRHLEASIQPGAKVFVKSGFQVPAFRLDPKNVFLQLAADAYEEVYGIRPLFTRDGGTIPVVEMFSRVFQAPVVLMGFGLPDENLHAPNEHFNLKNFDKGLLTITSFLKRL